MATVAAGGDDMDPIYRNRESLKPINNILNEVSKALEDGQRTASDQSDVNEALGAAGGIGVGGTIGFAGLYYAGVTGLSAAGITSGLATAGALVGGGMAAGIVVLAAPAVILGLVGYGLISNHNKHRLRESKEMLLQEALRKHSAILGQQSKESQANKDRTDYLTRLNILLRGIIDDLLKDLGREKKNPEQDGDTKEKDKSQTEDEDSDAGKPKNEGDTLGPEKA